MLGVRRLVHFGNHVTTNKPLDPGNGGYRAISPNQLQVQLSNKKGPASPLGQIKIKLRGHYMPILEEWKVIKDYPSYERK